MGNEYDCFLYNSPWQTINGNVCRREFKMIYLKHTVVRFEGEIERKVSRAERRSKIICLAKKITDNKAKTIQY